MNVVCFAGYSGSGKTTLLEQLIPALKARGLRVSVIKHAHHRFDIDQPGKDSWRHRRAGAAEVLIASDLSRARLAGEAIALATGVPLSIDPRWRELDFGAWDGMAPGDVEGAALARFWDDPDGHAPPGGERWSALVERVSSALGDLAARPTLIVTHGGAMRAALAVLCGFDMHQTWAVDLPYNCLLTLRVWPGATPTAQIAGLYP